MTRHLTLLLFGCSTLVGCSRELPPRSVSEFLDNPILLEAAMVRCSRDREKTRYDAECINARQAVDQIQAKEESEARAAAEARSESKRAALRRTQAAAAEARRRAADAERQQEAAEYFAEFGVLPQSDGPTTDPLADGNVPIAVVPDVNEAAPGGGGHNYESPGDDSYFEPPAANRAEPLVPQGEPLVPQGEPLVPQGEPLVPQGELLMPETERAETDLESIRDELRRRDEEGGG